MVGANGHKILTSYSCSKRTTKNHETFRPRRREYHTLGLKYQKSTLCFAMANLVSHIPTGFSMRHAFTILIVQLLAVSNYLDISRPGPDLFAEAIRIDSIEFPSHVLVGHPVMFHEANKKLKCTLF